MNLIPLNTRSLLDVGCGRGIIGALLRIYRMTERVVGIDGFSDYLDFCNKMNFYDDLLRHDLGKTSLPFADKTFDVVTCLEVIEHLPKKEGVKLLGEFERVADRVILTTPTIPFFQHKIDNNPFQQHISGWKQEEFIKRGYRVRGIGEFMFSGRHIKYVSFFISPLAYVFPRFSETLLAFKI